MQYNNYVADLHLNLHPEQISQLEKWYEHCRNVSDFFTIAYYPYQMVDNGKGFREECEIDPSLMREQWKEISDFLARRSKADGFVSFLGFEWQGNGHDGDHNVYFKDEQGPIELPRTYDELKRIYADRDVIAIPHHLAYSLGNRGKNWLTQDDGFSPLVEIYSHHGSSERDMTDLPMARHIHMGPRVDETSVTTGIKRGSHVGFIAAGDNHEIPAMVKNGRAGIWAKEYSKEAIWNAIKARRTYGFTGSKMSIWTELNGADMGSIVKTANDEATYYVEAVGNARVERIELYRNGEIDQIHLIKTPPYSSGQESVRVKFKIECGWGPNVQYFPDCTKRFWKGSLSGDVKVVSVEQVFSSFDNTYKLLDEHTVEFQATSRKMGASRWMRDAEMRTEGYIFEIEGKLSSRVNLSINKLSRTFTIKELLSGTSLIVFEDEAKAFMAHRCGITNYDRSDSWYHNAYKVRVCQASTLETYKVAADFKVPVLDKESSYYAIAIQADGQRVWSSPTWVTQV